MGIARKAKKQDILFYLGSNLKRLRKERGLTQDGLAFMCEIGGRREISRIEKGRCDIRLEKLEKIASCLKVSYKDLLLRMEKEE